MKPIRLWLGCLVLVAAGCAQVVSEETPAAPREFHKVRPAVVAGLFYPAGAEELGQTIDRFLAAARPAEIRNVRGLVCPHAGYEFSGPTAAWAYKLVAGRPFRQAIVLAPSHYAAFRGAALGDHDGLATPLGKLAVAALSGKLGACAPFAVNPAARVHRPPWASRAISPPPDPETPLTWEHALETQLPFLGRVLPAAEVVPAVLGEVDPAEVAKALTPHLDAQTLLVASSDLSHYYPEPQARKLDNACVSAVCTLNLQAMQEQEACGKVPIMVLMHLARQKGWKAQLLHQSTSGDATGDREHVVGYAAIAFYDPSPSAEAEEAHYTPEQRQTLLRLARESVASAVRGERAPEPDGQIDGSLRQKRACFVTLTKHGDLRGCIGCIFPQEPLGQAVVRLARSAAVEDFRFPPVSGDELKALHIEVSVLTVPQPLRYSGPDDLVAKLRPGVDGVVLRFAGGEATFLPQVWEQLPDAKEFLAHLSRKAGQSPDAWRDALREVLTYQVEAFHEKRDER